MTYRSNTNPLIIITLCGSLCDDFYCYQYSNIDKGNTRNTFYFLKDQRI